MRAILVGMLNMVAASLQATRLVSSLWVTARIMSASRAPACSSTAGCAALPITVRRSRRSCSVSSRAGVGVDDGDVVGFGYQALGHRGADLAGAQDDDFQIGIIREKPRFDSARPVPLPAAGRVS